MNRTCTCNEVAMKRAAKDQAAPGRPCHRRPAAAAPLLVLIPLLIAPLVRADAVKLDGFWHETARIIGFEDGRIVFINMRGQEVREPVDRLQSLRLDDEPVLRQAADVRAAGNPAQAATLLEQVAGEATEPWLKHYALWKRVEALDAAGQALPATETYLALRQLAPDPALLAAAPVTSVSAAPAPVRTAVSKLLARALQSAGDVAPGPLQRLAAAAQASAATPTEGEPVASAITLPTDLTDGPVVTALRRGAYDQALQQTTAAIRSSTGRMSRDLYLHGLAQLGLAETSGDADAYKDAGLSFMRVVTYFPRSSYAAPAWLEVGYVHQQIGRPQIAARLYARAAAMLDPETQPALARRAQTLAQSLPTTSDPDAPSRSSH
jgi:tetratricopeptide (TPR) repeat protein